MVVDVVLEQDKDRWFAMSHHEVDYFCEGLTLAETVQSFLNGFGWTLQANQSISAFVLRPPHGSSKLAPKGELHRIVTRTYKHEPSLSDFTVEFRFWLAAQGKESGELEAPKTASTGASDHPLDPTADIGFLNRWSLDAVQRQK